MINIEIVRNYLQAGLAVLPADKVRKCPVLPGWKRYQEELPTESEVHAWFSNHHNALCIVCGKVSGNLEIIDFDNQGELFPAWSEKIPSDLKAKLVIEKPPPVDTMWRTDVMMRCAETSSWHRENGKVN